MTKKPRQPSRAAWARSGNIYEAGRIPELYNYAKEHHGWTKERFKKGWQCPRCKVAMFPAAYGERDDGVGEEYFRLPYFTPGRKSHKPWCKPPEEQSSQEDDRYKLRQPEPTPSVLDFGVADHKAVSAQRHREFTNEFILDGRDKPKGFRRYEVSQISEPVHRFVEPIPRDMDPGSVIRERLKWPLKVRHFPVAGDTYGDVFRHVASPDQLDSGIFYINYAEFWFLGLEERLRSQDPVFVINLLGRAEHPNGLSPESRVIINTENWEQDDIEHFRSKLRRAVEWTKMHFQDGVRPWLFWFGMAPSPRDAEIGIDDFARIEVVAVNMPYPLKARRPRWRPDISASHEKGAASANVPNGYDPVKDNKESAEEAGDQSVSVRPAGEDPPEIQASQDIGSSSESGDGDDAVDASKSTDPGWPQDLSADPPVFTGAGTDLERTDATSAPIDGPEQSLRSSGAPYERTGGEAAGHDHRGQRTPDLMKSATRPVERNSSRGRGVLSRAKDRIVRIYRSMKFW